MTEFRRCLGTKKNLLVLITVLLFNIIFCNLQCNDTQSISLVGEELEQYINSYQDYIEQTLENAEQISILGLLQDKKSYSYQNLIKTAEDFKAMRNVKVKSGENRGIVLFNYFEITDLLLVGYGIFIVLIMTAEYKKNLSLLVFSTKKGRFRLGIKRIGIIVFSVCVCGIMLYGSNLLLINDKYPNMEWDRAIQSVPEFMKNTKLLTVKEYLFEISAIKILTAICNSLLLGTLIVMLRGTIAVILYGILTFLQIFAYKKILATSVFHFLKYLNLYALLKCEGYAFYLNLNIFNTPVELTKMQCLFVIISIIVIAFLFVFGHGLKSPEVNGILFKIYDKVNAFIQRRKPVFSPFWWEGYKILINQRALFIIAIVMYLAVSASMKTEYRDFRNKTQLSYYEEYKGAITEEKIESAKAAEKKIQKYLNNAKKNVEKIQQQMIQENGDVPNQVHIALAENQLLIQKYSRLLPALQTVLDNMQTTYEYSLKTDKELQLVVPFSYEMLLRDDEKTTKRNTLYCMIGIILFCSGIMSYEKTSNTQLLLDSMPIGKKKIIANKILWVIAISSILTLALHLVQYDRIGKVFPFEYKECIVQSLEILRDFPVVISIKTYLFLIYAIRCFYGSILGVLTMFIGNRTKSRAGCIALCLIIYTTFFFLL